MKQLFIIIIIVLSFINIVSAQEEEQKQLYSGGMLFLQPGYTITENQSQNIKSWGFGIGGFFRFYIKKHLTIGVIGGNQKTNYKSTNSENSYISLGYGGPFIGYTLAGKKIRFCGAISIGMGKIKNLHVENQDGTQLHPAYYYAYPAFVAYPIVSLDYRIMEKFSVVVQAIFLTAQYNKNDSYFCPLFQLGVAFSR